MIRTQSICTQATLGGMVPGAQVLRVTSKADSGPGTLRAALTTSGPRVVVFDVCGNFVIGSAINVTDPFLSVLGQSAPGPVLIRGHGIRAQGPHQSYEHLTIACGPGSSPGNRDTMRAGNRDNAAGTAQDGKQRQNYFTQMLNCAFYWSVDENLLCYEKSQVDMWVQDCIIAEAMRYAGGEPGSPGYNPALENPKGDHAMGFLVGENNRRVVTVGSLFAHNVFRNPVAERGTWCYFADNMVYSPYEATMHLYSMQGGQDHRLTYLNNILVDGPGWAPYGHQRSVVQIEGDIVEWNPGSRIFVKGAWRYRKDGYVEKDEAVTVGKPVGFALAEAPPMSATYESVGLHNVYRSVLRRVGPWPRWRDALCSRTIHEVETRTGKWRDGPTVPWPPEPTAVDPDWEPAPETYDGMLAYAARRHLHVGGRPTAIYRQTL